MGSEGTLGVITAADFRLIPAVEERLPVVGLFPSIAAGCEAITAVMASGIVAAAIEYLDAPILSACADAFPYEIPPGTRVRRHRRGGRKRHRGSSRTRRARSRDFVSGHERPHSADVTGCQRALAMARGRRDRRRRPERRQDERGHCRPSRSTRGSHPGND